MRFIPVLLLLSAFCTAAAAADLASRRGDFRRALETAERGPLSDYPNAAKPFADHPLAPYLEYAHLRRQLKTIAPEKIRRYLDNNADIPLSESLHEAWLRALIERRDWLHYRAFYVDESDPTLRCGALHARLVGGTDKTFLDDAQAMWLSGKSVPALCDGSFTALRVAGRITPALVWQRIELAAVEGNHALMRYLARLLPAKESAYAESYARFLAGPTAAETAKWPRDARSRRIATLGIKRIAQRDADVAEALFASIATPLALDANQRGEAMNQIALWSAASYLPNASQRLARVPAAAYDDRLHEWRAREALARNEYTMVRQSIAAMSEAQRADPRWRYIDARVREKLGEKPQAQADYASLAREPTYYGFLAADRLQAPYALCPLEADADRKRRDEVAGIPGIERAFELHALQRDGWALREWDAAMKSLDADERRIAVALADDAGWYDRAVFTLNSGEDLRYYSLRFPQPHARQLRAEAKKNGLDPAWVAALIRAESAWLADARSHANARGLMQLLPSTARIEAKRLGIPWGGDDSLYQPRGNITLGTAHLAQMLRKHSGRTYLATAAYNAGPTPVARWLAQRPPSEPDLWIETIPYRETRDYVARILAFSVIYDWRLHGKAVPVSRRMVGDDPARAQRREFACPAPLSVPAPVAKPS
jgi:soluble lytic murein transglycosylase